MAKFRKKEKKQVYIDADHLLYFVAMSGQHKPPKEFADFEQEGEDLDTGYCPPLKPLKKHFKALVKEYMEEVQIESIGQDWTPKNKPVLIYSDPNGNFRYDLLPEYKKNRPHDEKPVLFYKLRKWCHKSGFISPHTEADDVVAYYVRKGGIGISTDKDLLKGVAGIWYNSHHAHRKFLYTTKEDANRFVLLQSLMGDATDGIRGIDGMGIAKAEAFLVESTWDYVVNAYLGIDPTGEKPFVLANGQPSKLITNIQAMGLTEKDAILTRRLVDMSQWTPKKGIKLWKPKK